MISANRLRYRTLPVFVVGVGSLLALLFLPGFVALRRTAAVYHDIRRIQDGHQRTQQALADIERRLYLISITVREVLLDTSAGANATYRNAFHQYRRDIEDRLNALKRESRADTRLSIRVSNTNCSNTSSPWSPSSAGRPSSDPPEPYTFYGNSSARAASRSFRLRTKSVD